MGFRCGIVGLPNVGKSTLFNALTETAAAQAANYPFCTIEPNVGQVAVPDPRLAEIARIAQSAKIIETQLAFVDIAGLVRGASKGEGLGNQFLANIREVDAIVHVLRCFEGGDVTHVEGKVDPIADAETVETELMLADLDSLEKRVPNLAKKAAQGDKEAKSAAAVLGKALALLREGKPARLTVPADEDEHRHLDQAQLLTAKPVLYVCNVDEGSAAEGNALSARVFDKASGEGAKAVVVSAAIEAEIVTLEPADRAEFLSDLGLNETGLARVIRAGYELLDLITFFTAGPKETRAWTVDRGSKAPQAAGVIHTDFERGFIRAETIAYPDYFACNGEAGAREAGKLRSEGKEYVTQDGDIMLFSLQRLMLAFEDFAVGDVARFGACTVTREEVLAFAAAYDPQPFHLSDEAAALNPIFGRLAASGWHTAGMTMRMTVEHWLARGGTSLGSPGIDEVRFLKPVYPGDTLSVEIEVLSARPLASRPDRGIIISRTRTLNQDGDAVLSFVANTFWPRRG